VTITRSFTAMTPARLPLIAINGQKADAVFPKSNSAPEGEWYLCAANDGAVPSNRNDSSYTRSPALSLSLIAADAFENPEPSVAATPEFRACLPIAKIRCTAGQCTVVTEYAPPLTRLCLMNFFNKSALDDIQGMLESMTPTLKESYWKYADIAARCHKDGTLPKKALFILQCSTFFIDKAGYVRAIGRISPMSFLLDVIYPFTELLHFYVPDIPQFAQHKENASLKDGIEWCRKIPLHTHGVYDTSALLAHAKVIIKVISSLSRVGA
jgi:hypothetical protein